MSESKLSENLTRYGKNRDIDLRDGDLHRYIEQAKQLEQKLADAEKQNEWISEWNLEILEEGKGILRHSDGSGVVMNTLRDCPIAESLLLRFAKDVFKITPPQEGK